MVTVGFCFDKLFNRKTSDRYLLILIKKSPDGDALSLELHAGGFLPVGLHKAEIAYCFSNNLGRQFSGLVGVTAYPQPRRIVANNFCRRDSAKSSR